MKLEQNETIQILSSLIVWFISNLCIKWHILEKMSVFFRNLALEEKLRLQRPPQVLQSLLGPLGMFSTILQHI